MLQTENLDSELYSAIALLDDMQKRAILSIVKAFKHNAEEAPAYNWEDDPEFVAELESRWADYKNGGKVYSAKEIDAEVKVLLHSFKNK
jgi:hypothetical protein